MHQQFNAFAGAAAVAAAAAAAGVAPSTLACSDPVLAAAAAAVVAPSKLVPCVPIRHDSCKAICKSPIRVKSHTHPESIRDKDLRHAMLEPAALLFGVLLACVLVCGAMAIV